MVKNHERLLQRIESLHFDMENPENKEAYEQYERKMELTDQMKGLKKDIETAKTLVLTVSK